MNISFERNRENTTTTWLTPPDIIKALGEFDLDPCCPEGMPWQTAPKHYTPVEDGLQQPWSGRVWLNPPYGEEMPSFLKKMAKHGNGIALIPGRMETRVMHEEVFPYAKAILFKKGRIQFMTIEGKVVTGNGVGSLLVAYSDADVEALRNSGIEGKLVLM